MTAAPTFHDIMPLADASIYDGIEALQLAFDGQTFPSTSAKIFETLVAKHKPTRIIEVGSHKGGSAVRWAELAGPECKVYCVDTWLESGEAFLNAQKTYKVIYQHYHPMTFFQFLNNIKIAGYHRQVVPIVNTSSEGAIILKAHGITAPLIFIDGSHTFRAAYYDIVDYWELLESGGSMLVDDLSLYPDVTAACLRFVAERGLWKNFTHVEDGVFGLFSKP